MTARVLYLDDNPSNLKLMRMVMSARADIELSVARDGAEGLRVAQSQPFDLVLVDLYLPDARGDEVVKRLRSHEATAEVPAVVVSAEDDIAVVAEAMQAGADAYVTKPFDVAELMLLVDKLLAASVAQDGS
ncbi:MAG: response regulator [Actinomycetota bacterium]